MKGLSTLTRTKGGICMLKNLKKVAAIVLSFAMAVQFGLADSYYVNAVEEPVEPQQEETTTAAPQEQEEVPTAEEETPQQQEEQQQPAVEEEQPAPETKSVELSYVAEDGTVLHETASRDFNLDYSLKTDSSVMLNFDGYTLKDVIINNSQTVPADQANLSVTSDLVSVKFVYVSVNTKEDKQTSENNEQTKTEEANEDDAEADPETKEELPEYPAFDQSETAGNVVVHATAAEGVLPRDSKLVVKRITRKAILNAVEDTVSEKNKEMDSAVALDITIQNKDGVEIQPNGSVNISFENAAVSGDEINVYHVTDDASAVTEVATNTQSFDANHFSIYVITGEKEKPLTTFNFVDANGKPVSTQIVKTGDTLITPTAPDVAGKAFVGWYEGETKFEDFNTALTITETKTRTITAKYENALYVYFYNPAGTQIMRTEKVGDHEVHGYTDVSYDVDSTHKLVGWAAERNGTENIADKITVPKGSTSVNVYAIIKEGYWISFDSNGGSIVDSQFVLNGDKLVLNKSTTPTKPGYTFNGWYNDSTKVENGATVTNPMTLKAHWTAAEVNYTINYWQQKVTDDKNATDAQKTYEYVEAVTEKATTGTKISATNSKTYKGFKYNANNSSKDVEIAGDGTTIINVYYDRVLCTVNFYVDKGGYYWSDWQITKTVTGLYGANLPEGAWDSSKNLWFTTKSYGSNAVLLTSFDFETAGYAKNQDNVSENGIVTTCNFYAGSGLNGTIKYYNEQADGTFKLVQTVRTNGNSLTVHEKYEGYELYKYSTGSNAQETAQYWNNRSSVKDKDVVNGNIINIASKLKTYSLSYYNYNKVTKTEKSIKYTASLKSYANYTPARPSELPDYYVFGGWYKDKACTTKFDFNTEKMPNANVQIYAKWTAKKINLTYNLNTPDGTSKKVNRDVDAGTIASTVLPSASEIEGYSFAGWYYADGNGHMTTKVFNANDAITKDTSVIGKWLYNGELTVVYDPGKEGTKATVPTDSNIYAGGAKVTVAKNATTTSKKKFLGWKLKGNLYHPGDAFEVNKDLANDDNVITLTAIWGNEESSTTMSYNPGNGRGDVTKVEVKNNESVTLKSEKDFGYQAPEKEGKEYYFAGWATSMDDANNGKATYAAGQTVHVDVNGENVLYATWIEKTVITLVANSNSVTYNGEAQSVEGFGDVADGYTISNLTAKATGTNVGEYTTKIEGTAKVTKGGEDVTEKVVVNVVSGKLTISRRNVTLTSASDEKVYDGNALTNDTVTADGFVEGQGATYNVTGTITNVGEKANAFEYSLNKGTKADNYNITKTEGTLKVTPVTDQVTVTITGNTGSVKYDGDSHEVTGYTTSFSNALYTANDFEFNGTAEASRTDAGQTNMGLAAEQFTNTSANFTNVEFVVTDGYSKVNKRTVTLTSASDEKVYDGNALTKKKVTESEDGFAKGEGATYDVTGSQTNVGSSKNTFTYTLNEGTNADNYEITKTEGTLKVTPITNQVTVTITGNTGSVKYDGDSHEVTGYTTSFSNALYTANDFEFNGTAEASRTDAGQTDMGLAAEQFTNTSDNFTNVEFVVTDGYSKVEKRNVTLTSASDEKVYDGNPLTNGTVTAEGFVEGQGATYGVTGSQTDAGESKNTFTYTLNEGTNPDNYNITKTEGTLKVTPVTDKVTVTITGNTDSVKYDGNSHKVTGYTTSFSNDLYTANDFEFSGTAEVNGKDADTYKMGLKKDQFKNTSKNFTNVEFVVTDGQLVIGKRTVTLTSGSDSKIYNGKPLTNGEVTVTGDGFANGEGAAYNVTGTITNVGETDNTFTYTLNKGTNPDNYEIKKAEGKLIVTADASEVVVTITENSANITYDGNEHEATGYTTSITGGTDYKEEDFTFNGNASVKGTDAGTYNMELKPEDFQNTNNNYSKVTFVIVDGTLTISKRNVTLTSASDEKVYDGNALTNGTVTAEGFVEGQGATYDVTGSQKDVGESKNTFSYTLNEGTNADNYNITKTEGTLKVTPVTDKVVVEIEGKTKTETYNGNTHEVEGYDVTKVSDAVYPEEAIHFEGAAKASRKDVGTSYMGLNASQFSNTSSNFTNVTFKVTDGWLKVNPKSITPDGPNTPDEKKTGIKVTKPDDTMYNGEEQKNKPTVEDTKTGATLVENVDYTLSYTAAVDAGTVEVTITGIGNYTGTAKTSYEITKRNVTLTSASASKTYDKTPLTKKEVTVSGDGFVKEEGATYNVTGSQTKKGTSKNTFTYELKSNTKASNYTIKVVYGDLTVTAEDGEVVVVITGHKKSFEYDGNEKSVKGYDVSITQGSKYAESDFTFNGNDEVKGTEANTYPMGLKASDFTNNNDNYNKVKFVVTDGSLTITPKSITPDGPNTPENKKTGITATDPADSIYDGKAHVNPLTVKDTKTNKDLVENKDYTLTYSDDVVNVGTVTVTVKGIGNYTGEFTKKYQITPREYTVTTDSANKTYDGTALTAGGHVNGLVEGETVNFKTTGSQTNEGTSDNTYELKFKGTAVETNYKHGKDSIGKLKVTKKSIVPDGPDTPDEKKTGIKVTKPDDTMYNGKEQKNKPVVRDTKRDVKLVEDKDYTLSYTAAINAGTVTVTITGIGNYEGTVNTSYEITPRKVIMTSADDTKVYDGNVLTKKKVTESGNGFVEGEGATYDVTGSQTDVGFSNNTFSYKLNKGTLASNYTIETKEGRLEVTPFTDKVTVTITGHKDTAVYDGKSHSVEGYDVTKISNALYKKADVQFNGTAKAEGIEVGTYTMKLTPAQFENKNRNFADVEFVVNDGKLEITPKSITPDGPNTPDEKKTGIKVTKPDDTMYNGEEQKNKPTVEDTKTGATLVENVDYTLSYTAAVDAGTVEVTITGKGNYTGTAKTSYEITKRDVLLTSATDSKVYDKKPLMNGKVTESGSGFVKEEGATYNVTGSQTKKGSSKNEFTYELKSNTKASNYTIEVVYGDLTVTAENGEVVVVITGHKKSFEYDGHEKSVKGYDVSITKGSTYEVSDFTFNGNDEVKGTEANTYPMGLKVSDFTNNNDNYNKVKFVVTDGSLTITPKSITPDGPNTPENKKTGITATDPADSIYDGKAHVNPLTVKDTKTNKDLVENKDYTLTYSDDVVNVGTVTVTVKGIGNYTGEFTKKYQITPREYTVTTDSANKTYDGTALTAGGHVNGLVEGETVNFKTTGSQTNEGTSDNTYELKFKGTAVETNYKHGKDSIGKLTVKKQSIDPGTDPEKPNPNYLGIEISDPSDEVYDGKEHKWSPTVVDKTGKELIVGTDYAVEYATSDFTNVGTINVTITGIGNYTGKVTRTYSITPREYTITTLDGTKVYDGKALTNFGLVDGIVYGETYSFKTTGSQTEVGTSDNTYEFKWDGTAKKSNYKLAKESIGKLTVKAKSIVPDGPDTPNEKKTGITVSEPSDSKYDGKEHKEVLTVTDTKTGKELVAGTDYSVTYSSDLVNAGTVKVTVAGLGNYTGSFTKTYKIIKRSVTLTSATVSKVYDGSALTNTSIAVSGDGFVKGEGASYEVTGTQTEVGNSANAFEYKLNEKTLASNYNITKVVGTLTITAAPAPVTPATPSTPSSTTSTTPRTPSAPQVITPAETVEKETTPKAEPKKEEKVEEEYTPKASPQYYWALINLICAILTVLFGLLLLISKRHKDEDDDEEDDETKQQTNNDDEEKEQEKKRGLFTRVLAVLIAIVSVVFFLVTEDLSLPWTWTDQWTIWMVVIGFVQIVVFFVGRKWKNVDNDDDDEEAQQA
jgi:uncharacterized repeat protein (TIGR02543 family)